MQKDVITIQLRLPGLVVLGVEEGERWIEVAVQYRQEEAVCPGCGRSTWQVHQWHLQRKRDAKLWGKEVWLALFKRRFRCRHCRKVFTEPDPACGLRRRTTGRLRGTVARRAREATVRSVAREEGVSEGLVERSWMEAHSMVSVPVQPHVFLGLDGFCVRRPGRMWTGMWDLESGKAVAVVPGERQADAERMLERHASRESVRAVVIDLSEAYRQAVELVLPDAAIVADKFHVLALAGRALHGAHGETRRKGNLAWLLQRGAERLSPAERERLLEALSQDSRLARAWGLKEALREVYRKKSQEEASVALERWTTEAEQSGLRPFQRTAATLRKWRREVLNYWRYPITNALVEGKHNRVKVLKRRAYGYRNERSFLLRILSLIHTD
ncbi:MAG: ISL3 family transposase [Thermoanaerobaculia bacterium]